MRTKIPQETIEHYRKLGHLKLQKQHKTIADLLVEYCQLYEPTDADFMELLSTFEWGLYKRDHNFKRQNFYDYIFGELGFYIT